MAESASTASRAASGEWSPSAMMKGLCCAAFQAGPTFNYYIILCCWFFGPVDVREACFGPCVVAGAYAAVID